MSKRRSKITMADVDMYRLHLEFVRRDWNAWLLSPPMTSSGILCENCRLSFLSTDGDDNFKLRRGRNRGRIVCYPCGVKIGGADPTPRWLVSDW